MRLTSLGTLVLTAAISSAQPAVAVYIALGDSITFGETDLEYAPLAIAATLVYMLTT